MWYIPAARVGVNYELNWNWIGIDAKNVWIGIELELKKLNINVNWNWIGIDANELMGIDEIICTAISSLYITTDNNITIKFNIMCSLLAQKNV